MHVLVTGGAGFIGSNLVRLLLSEGHQILNIDKLTYAGNLSSLSTVEDHPGYRHLQADICDAPNMKAAFADFKAKWYEVGTSRQSARPYMRPALDELSGNIGATIVERVGKKVK